MEHEAITARRRLAAISAHFPATSYDSVSPASLVPLNCSSSLDRIIRRCDNRMNFSRQASSAQSRFMRQRSANEFLQRTISQKCVSFKCSATGQNERQTATEAPQFSRPAQGLPPQFSRPTKEELYFSPNSTNRKMEHCKRSSNPGLPKIARTGTGWSPSSDIAECERCYVMTVELPGANVEDLRVEVDEKKLTVTGRRYSLLQKAKDPLYGYHKREILQGPFHVSWSLPSNANKDSVGAEFMDGLLKIVIPKL